MRRPAPLVLLAVLLAVLLPVGAARAAVLDDAARALATDPVYVAPGARPGLTPAEADALRRRIERGDAGPVYVAVLPASALAEAGGDPAEVTRLLARRLGRPGTYVTVAGGRFRAGSTDLRGVSVLARKAFEARHGQGLAATLLDFVDRVAQARSRAHAGGAGGGSSGGGGGGLSTVLLVILAVLGGGALLATGAARRRRRQEEQRQLEDLRAAARDDLVALGDDVRDVDIDVEMPGIDPRAREELGRGLAAYERAEGLQGARGARRTSPR
jgi:hypothetical protein